MTRSNDFKNKLKISLIIRILISLMHIYFCKHIEKNRDKSPSYGNVYNEKITHTKSKWNSTNNIKFSSLSLHASNKILGTFPHF